jgi:outer membrane protein assembly factor BamD
LLPGKSNDKYAELTGTVAPGRDRVLFVEAAHEVRKGNHETGRLLFTTIITTYPDSPYLPLAKLAIADSFYLEGTTSSLIQAGQS